jgi:transposase InsO family protein
MPWKESDAVSERMIFVTRLLEGEAMTDLCLEFGISRKTGYKLRERFKALGPEGLYDFSRKPQHSPQRTSEEIRKLVIQAKRTHSSWGPKKLRYWLSERCRGVRLPAPSTIGEILSREGLVKPRRRRSSLVSPYRHLLREATAPNDVWCADYKGQFRLGNGRYCYPLTVTDQYSRYLLACEGFEAIDGRAAKQVFDGLFTTYGLPKAIRTDNGAPFASRALFGLSRLSAWWLRLGIVPERIQPSHPEQNGRHERMHRTLKEETIRPTATSLLAQQERFDRFRVTFNDERPHEALRQRPPNRLYKASKRSFAAADPELRYPLHDETRMVDSSGHMRIVRTRGWSFFLSLALAGERVGIRELKDGRWLVSFASLDLGCADVANQRFEPADLGKPLRPPRRKGR